VLRDRGVTVTPEDADGATLSEQAATRAPATAAELPALALPGDPRTLAAELLARDASSGQVPLPADDDPDLPWREEA
jgi:hypothetical protein